LGRGAGTHAARLALLFVLSPLVLLLRLASAAGRVSSSAPSSTIFLFLLVCLQPEARSPKVIRLSLRIARPS
jgi:hypothetical protein